MRARRRAQALTPVVYAALASVLAPGARPQDGASLTPEVRAGVAAMPPQVVVAPPPQVFVATTAPQVLVATTAPQVLVASSMPLPAMTPAAPPRPTPPVTAPAVESAQVPQPPAALALAPMSTPSVVLAPTITFAPKPPQLTLSAPTSFTTPLVPPDLPPPQLTLTKSAPLAPLRPTGDAPAHTRSGAAQQTATVGDVPREGVASWYGPHFHGRQTASGETYDQDAMTVAHRSLPFGTLIAVTCLDTGRSCVLRVNDRGPYHGRRILDCSREAAKELGYLDAGVAHVRWEIVGRKGKEAEPEPVPQPSPAATLPLPGRARERATPCEAACVGEAS